MGLVIRFLVFAFWIIPGSAAEPGDQAYPILLRDMHDREHKITHFTGNLTVVHFWATWCHACLHELPDLIDTSRELKSKGWTLILVAADSKEATLRYMQKHNLHANVLIDQYGKAMHDYKIDALPASVFIDNEGNIMQHRTGSIDWKNYDPRSSFTIRTSTE